MHLNADWKSKLNQIPQKKQQLLVMLLVGILLLVIAVPTKKTAEKTERTVEKTGGAGSGYEVYMERKLKETLQYMAGVGKVEVMITLKSTTEKVIEKDRESTNQHLQEADTKGGERTTVDGSSREETVYAGENENRKPYVKKEMTPEVEGVVVIAQGGENPLVVRQITEAVQALFHVDTHKIKIMKMNQKK